MTSLKGDLQSKLDPRYKRVIDYWLINGMNKADACVKAGFSRNTVPDIFNRKDVKEEIERRLKVSEQKTNMDREWLLNKLRMIIESSPGELLEVDEAGRPSMNWNLLTPGLKAVINKITVDTSRDGGKYKRSKTHITLSRPDMIAAIKEAAILLGLREQKTKIDFEESLIETLAKRRGQLSEEEDG